MLNISACAGKKRISLTDYTDLIHLDQYIRQAGSIAVGGHEHPDGDCAGSTTGLVRYINNMCPQTQTDLYLEKIPDAYAFLGDGIEIRDHIDEERAPYDLFICLDCGVIERLGFAQPVFNKALKTICIDHHISNPGFADINRICPHASSTSEMLAEEMDAQYVDTDVARSLFLGIVHDTGVFQCPCTSPGTHRIAADLLRYDFNAPELITETFYEKTMQQQKIAAQAMLNARLAAGGAVITSMITAAEMQQYDVLPEHLDGIVAQMRDTKGVECALFMYERGKDEWKVSLRSRSYVDVRQVAQAFGGGGHRKAAGVTFNTDKPEDAMSQVVSLVSEQIDRQEKSFA